MFNRFKQMIEQGVAPAPYDSSKNVLPNETPETDYICRVYNNFWSVVTDTHMSMMEDGRRVITGSFVARTETGHPDLHVLDRFLSTPRWGACEFPCSFVTIMIQNRLILSYENINGAECAVLTQEQPTQNPTV